MSLSIVPIGAGSATSKEFNNSNFFLEFENGKRYLLDCGITFPKLWLRQYDMCHLDGILITHTHADHVGGLDEVVVHYRKQFKEKIELYLMQDVFHYLWDWKLRGGLKPTSDDPNTFFNLHLGELPPEFERGQWLRTNHVTPEFPTYGIAFVSGGTLVWISGDSTFMPETFGSHYWQDRFGSDMPDVMLHEVDFDDRSNKSHSYYGRLAELSPNWKSRMHLYHYPERWRDVQSDGFAGYILAGEKLLV